MKCDFEYYQMVFPKIIEAIRLAGAPYSVQVSLFPRNLNPAYEIADFVEDALRYSRILYESSFISHRQLTEIEFLNSQFDNFVDEVWNEKSLLNSECWEDLRNSAKSALKVFSTEYATPILYWVKDIW
jgi:hypothetical protein